ncbi:hypothetical protein C8R43DRAFT_987423 [Mycena crocata]|nr:hypothetical protein C8R43DRAFT_987423 [Mycena crocata]
MQEARAAQDTAPPLPPALDDEADGPANKGPEAWATTGGGYEYECDCDEDDGLRAVGASAGPARRYRRGVPLPRAGGWYQFSAPGSKFEPIFVAEALAAVRNAGGSCRAWRWTSSGCATSTTAGLTSSTWLGARDGGSCVRSPPRCTSCVWPRSLCFPLDEAEEIGCGCSGSLSSCTPCAGLCDDEAADTDESGDERLLLISSSSASSTVIFVCASEMYVAARSREVARADLAGSAASA